MTEEAKDYVRVTKYINKDGLPIYRDYFGNIFPLSLALTKGANAGRIVFIPETEAENDQARG